MKTPLTQQKQQQFELTQVELNQTSSSSSSDEEEEEEAEEIIVWKPKRTSKEEEQNMRITTSQICIEGYIEEEDDVPTRTKSLTGDDLDELKGCFDLGFGFTYHHIPQLCHTLPALQLCYSMSQKDHQHGSCCGSSGSDSSSVSGSESSSPVTTWKISSPGDHPEDVKARLKFWAQAVACTVKLCS